jgi:hypothetical protein
MASHRKLKLQRETLLHLSEGDIARVASGEPNTGPTGITVIVTISRYTPKITETISYFLCDPTATKGGTNERSVCQICQA